VHFKVTAVGGQQLEVEAAGNGGRSKKKHPSTGDNIHNTLNNMYKAYNRHK
jgi:hypothetical protein